MRVIAISSVLAKGVIGMGVAILLTTSMTQLKARVSIDKIMKNWDLKEEKSGYGLGSTCSQIADDTDCRRLLFL